MAWEGDFIEDFMVLTEGLSSPLQFRLWGAISLLAGALERRVWARATPRPTYPNLYVLLTAAPGVGKQVILVARDLMTHAIEPGSNIKAFRVNPDQMTKASLIDTLAKSKNMKLLPGGNLTYHSLQVIAEEFEVLLPNYDKEYIATLNSIFNNPELPYTEVRRTGSVREVAIELPQLNIFAGVQPSYFVSTFPEEAWTTGFARRIIMIYAGEAPFQELFQEELELGRPEARERVLRKMSLASDLYGQMKWTHDAASALAEWHRAGGGKGGPPIPSHSKLQHYNNSRTMFAIKLAIVSAVARAGGMVIEEIDVKRALTWLLEAERLMPDVFREMLGKSDSQVIDELHYFALALWAKNGRKPIATGTLWEFLRQRVPSEKIERILMTSDKAGIVIRVEGTESWVPKARHERGVE